MHPYPPSKSPAGARTARRCAAVGAFVACSVAVSIAFANAADAAAAPPPSGMPAANAGGGTRTYDVLLGSSKIGTTRFTFNKQEDGSLLVKSEADIKVSILFVNITYQFRGYEIWKDGALVRLASNCNDNGDKRAVEAVSDKGQLKVTVNGQEKTIAAGVWTTSFWGLPAMGQRGPQQRYFDADSGRLQQGKLALVGREQCSAAGHTLPCTHYHVSHDEEVDVWFDDIERLVRIERTKLGKRVIVALASETH
jgi:hypothetical protein